MDELHILDKCNRGKITMCDAECRKRFKAIELDINSMTNDLKWMRWIGRGVIIVIGGFFGLDLTKVIG